MGGGTPPLKHPEYMYAYMFCFRANRCVCCFLSLLSVFLCGIASRPAAMGGLGVRSAERTAPAAYWAAWADALVPLRDRLPEGADGYTEPLEAGGGHATCLQDAAEARRTLQGERWADCPTWRVVFEGQFARAASETSAGGWQGHATRIQTKYYRDRVFRRFSARRRARKPACGSLPSRLRQPPPCRRKPC